MSKFEHIKDEMIRESLEKYKDKIEGNKNNELDLSDYRIVKPWGSEYWLELNEFYAYKMICMNKGCKTSLQLHKKKYESTFVISGVAEVLLENKNGDMISHIYIKGTGWSVPVGRKHRVIAIEDYISLEVSTPHLTDVERFEDEFGRGNGEISSEHKV